MKYDYQYKIVFPLNSVFDVNYINKISEKYKDARILVEVQNTKDITSSMIRKLGSNVLIRIAGGYDDKRISRFDKDLKRSSNYYQESVIYSKNETIRLLEEMEKLESGLNKNWSDIQKLIYIYDRLKRGIMYDPSFEHKASSEIRSLRGLITKQTVCAGYAMIFKEFMDRNGISCEYVEGFVKANMSGGHAWNIVNIDGKKYPVDLTWDNARFRSGKSKTFDWLGTDVETFSKSHYPAKGEETQDYQHTLSQIDQAVIKDIYMQTGIYRAQDYRMMTYYGIRKDGTKFVISQVGDSKINNHNYYRYYYAEIDNKNGKSKPILLYSDTNITFLMDCKRFGRPIPDGYEEAVDNILFSRENIADSLSKRTYYIGCVKKNSTSNKLEIVSSVQQIAKPEEKRNLFVYPTKVFERSDGSVFIAQQMFNKPFKVKGIDVMRYDIFEMVRENDRAVLKRNVVYTEKNFFKDNRQSMIDDYLSRERLDRKVAEAGGYIGYYSSSGMRIINSDLVNFFTVAKKLNMNQQKKGVIPTFDELKELAKKYEIYIDAKNLVNFDCGSMIVRDRKTKKNVDDEELIKKATFANLWLTAAGMKVFSDEEIPGERYAFNEEAQKLYEVICEKLLKSAEDNGVIDTVSLFKDIEKYSSYKYNREIIVKLFRTKYQTELINEMFLSSLGKGKSLKEPDTLFTASFASNLAYGNKEKIS